MTMYTKQTCHVTKLWSVKKKMTVVYNKWPLCLWNNLKEHRNDLQCVTNNQDVVKLKLSKYMNWQNRNQQKLHWQLKTTAWDKAEWDALFMAGTVRKILIKIRNQRTSKTSVALSCEIISVAPQQFGQVTQRLFTQQESCCQKQRFFFN